MRELFRTGKIAVLFVGLHLLLSGTTFGQEDRNVTIMKTIYSKLAGVFSVGQQNSPTRDQNFLVLANPGFFVSPQWDMHKVDDRYKLSLVLNALPNSSWIYGEHAGTVGDLYSEILNNYDAPHVSLSAAEKRDLGDAKSLLFVQLPDGTLKASAAYDAYNACLETYGNALDRYNAAMDDNASHGTRVPNSVITQLAIARNKLQGECRENEIEAALETYERLTGRNPAVWWAELKKQYNSNLENTTTNVSFPTMVTIPDYSAWTGNNGWATYTIDDSDLTTTQRSTLTTIGGGLSASWGLWSVGGSYNSSTATTYSKSDVQQFSIALDVMRVSVRRPWMQSSLLRSRSWRWDPQKVGAGLDTNPLSDGGDITHGRAPLGRMPLVITGLLLSRNVKIATNLGSTTASTYSHVVDTGGSVGWGPFSIGAHYHDETHEAYAHGTITSDGITIPDVQVIGFFCDVLPQSPYPDPSLTWVPPISVRDFPQVTNASFVSAIRAEDVAATQRAVSAMKAAAARDAATGIH